MSHGYCCKFCGYYETEHDLVGTDESFISKEDEKKVLPGRRVSLAKCKRFTLTKKDELSLKKWQKEEEEKAKANPTFKMEL